MNTIHFILFFLLSVAFLAETAVLQFNKGNEVKKSSAKRHRQNLMGGFVGMAIRNPISGPGSKKNQQVKS
uniref:Uncharacterized protein n=1 Tax=Caenorhabditis tropicalis TaxID=1561998 RepID=A0A1I7TKA9_9PELO